MLPEIRVSRTGLGVWFIPLVGFGLAWNVLLLSGYDLGQLIYGARVLVSDAPGGGDVSRSFAYSGLALLTTLLLFCPLLVWIVTLAFWMPLDPLGSLPLLAQAVITALTGIGFPVLATVSPASSIGSLPGAAVDLHDPSISIDMVPAVPSGALSNNR